MFGFRHAALMSLSLSLLTSCDAFDNAALEQLRRELADAGNNEPPEMDAGTDAGAMDAGNEPQMDAAVDAGIDSGGPEPIDCAGGRCWWSGETTEGCETAGKPTAEDRPASDSDRELPPIYLGISRLRLGNYLPDGTEDVEAWTMFGLDLDGVCTNSSTCEASSEVACISPAPELPFDGLHCRDNTFARLQPVAAMVPEIGETFGLAEEVFNCALWRGDYTVVTKISGYNGESNDDQVRLDFYTSIGMENQQEGWTCPQDDFDERYPLWRANQRWLINEADLAEPRESEDALPDSVTPVPNAYVRDGYIVALLPPDMVFRMAGDRTRYRGFRLVLQNGIWTGRLEQKQDSTWRLRDGLLAGALKKEDLLKAFREIGLCQEGELGAFYESVETYVTENADLLADGTVDPEAQCDAMSLGILLEADPVTPGTLTPISEPEECPPIMDPDADGGV